MFYPGKPISPANPAPVALYGTSYEAIAAAQADVVLGGTGAVGDTLLGLLVIPMSVSPGAISIKDGEGAPIPVFAGGANSLSNLVPFFIPVQAASLVGPWTVTTGANMVVLATGSFT